MYICHDSAVDPVTMVPAHPAAIRSACNRAAVPPHAHVIRIVRQRLHHTGDHNRGKPVVAAIVIGVGARQHTCFHRRVQRIFRPQPVFVGAVREGHNGSGCGGEFTQRPMDQIGRPLADEMAIVPRVGPSRGRIPGQDFRRQEHELEPLLSGVRNDPAAGFRKAVKPQVIGRKNLFCLAYHARHPRAGMADFAHSGSRMIYRHFMGLE